MARVWRQRDWLAEHFIEGDRAKQAFTTFREAQGRGRSTQHSR